MKVQLSLESENLKNVAKRRLFFRKKSCPFAVVLLHPPDGGPADILGKTEVVEYELSPKWHTQFVINYDPRYQTYINVFIFDKSTTDQKREYITVTQTEGYKIMDSIEVVSVNEILQTVTKGDPYELEMGVHGRKLRIFAECQDEDMTRGSLFLHLRGIRLKNIERGGLLKGLIDPYYEIWKSMPSSDPETKQWSLVYRSESVSDHINPMWDPCRIDLMILSGGMLSRTLEIRVYDWEKAGNHRLIGAAQTNVEEIIQLSEVLRGNGDLSASMQLVNKMTPTKSMGALVVLKASLEEEDE